MKVKKMTDPKKVKPTAPGRVHATEADAARQRKNEGSNSPFQQRLRKAESTGEGNFQWDGREIAARKNPDIKRPEKKLATMSKMGLQTTPIKGPEQSPEPTRATPTTKSKSTPNTGGFFGRLFQKKKDKKGGVPWKMGTNRKGGNKWGGDRNRKYKG